MNRKWENEQEVRKWTGSEKMNRGKENETGTTQKNGREKNPKWENLWKSLINWKRKQVGSRKWNWK